MLIIFNQMVSLFLLMLTGYLANRSGVIDKTFESKVSRFIVNISLPATILNAVTGSDMAHDQEAADLCGGGLHLPGGPCDLPLYSEDHPLEPDI